MSVHLKNILLKLVIVVIEQLPVELRDRFTDMREMDLQVQSKYSVFQSFVITVYCKTCNIEINYLGKQFWCIGARSRG